MINWEALILSIDESRIPRMLRRSKPEERNAERPTADAEQ